MDWEKEQKIIDRVVAHNAKQSDQKVATNRNLIIAMEECEPQTPEWIRARNNLATQNMKLVEYTIKSILNLTGQNYVETLKTYNIDREDLLQAGHIGLLEACSKARSDRAHSFPKYAQLHIKKRITQYFYHNRIDYKLSDLKGSLIGKMRKRILTFENSGRPVSLEAMFSEFPDHSEMVVSEVFEMLSTKQDTMKHFDDPDFSVANNKSSLGIGISELLSEDSQKNLAIVLKSLPYRERAVIAYRFGLKTGKPESYAKTEKEFGWSGSEVRRLEKLGFAKLLHPTRQHLLFLDV